MTFYDITKASIDGHYENACIGKLEEFFGSYRLRAMIQHHIVEFANDMQERGYIYEFTEIGGSVEPGESEDEPEGEPEGDEADSETPNPLRREEALRWVRENLERTRGRHLPGNFNSLLVGELFWEQSERWEPIAKKHLRYISELCRDFAYRLLSRLCHDDIRSHLWASHIEDSLKRRLEESEAELARVIKDTKRYPMIYNDNYIRTIQETLSNRAVGAITESVDTVMAEREADDPNGVTPHRMTKFDLMEVQMALSEQVTQDMDERVCLEALDCLNSFYEVTLARFTDNVITQVIERHLVDGLEEVFSPTVVAGYDDDDIVAMALEPEGVTRRREFLESRMETLIQGLKLFRPVLRPGLRLEVDGNGPPSTGTAAVPVSQLYEERG